MHYVLPFYSVMIVVQQERVGRALCFEVFQSVRENEGNDCEVKDMGFGS